MGQCLGSDGIYDGDDSYYCYHGAASRQVYHLVVVVVDGFSNPMGTFDGHSC